MFLHNQMAQNLLSETILFRSASYLKLPNTGPYIIQLSSFLLDPL